ncbi:MAG: protein kinase [Candidatus Melainabacteria bacterium]|nr:protein kinase [Candidatus Melainabacteria bacterium]
MAQDPSGEDRFGFDFHEKTQHTGEISSKPYEATSGFALNELIGGSYRVLEFIGEGGMGLVYKVEHIHMNKILALKVLKTEQLSENVWKRFRLEAQAISRLDHANIIKIYDMNQTPDGRPFYTMELLSGESLADYLQEHQRLPINLALPIFRQVCSALAYAHERGIIHRDIKPGNIMLLEPTGSGLASGLGSRVKIVDFGIVKVLDSAEQIGQGLTMQGEVFGSPLYMSPEQCAGSKLDARTDMYSVGVTLFQALAGKPPLLGRSAAETTIMHHTVIPPSLAEVAGVDFPPELEAVVAKMLAKAPDDRYRSLAEVASVLLTIERKYSGAPLPLGSTEPLQINEALFDNDLISDENSETGESNSLENRNSKSVLAIAAFFSIVAIVAIIFLCSRLWASPTKPKVAVSSATFVGLNPSIESSKKQLAAELEAVEVSSSPETDKAVALFMKERKEPYFTRAKDGTVTFSFPGQISIGVIETIGVGGQKSYEAMGQFKVRPWRQISFTANAISLAHPELLKFFPANSLDCLKLAGRTSRSAVLIDYIMGQQNLSVLDLSATEITESDLRAISGLRKLFLLLIDTKNISNRALFDSKLLPRLEVVGLLNLSDCTPVLQSLLLSKNVKSLVLTSAKLKKSDIAIIAKMTQLTSLELSGTNLDDNDLKQLTVLRKVKFVNLFATNITKKSVPTLRRFPALHDPILPPEVSAVYFGAF